MKYSQSRLMKMDREVYIQLIYLFTVNIIFIFSGMISNLLVIVIFWKSSQLRKKLCHFMIMLLSCFDLLAVITNHPIQAIYSLAWYTENYEILSKLRIYMDFSKMFLGFSLLALLVMSFERYLSSAYPLYHRRSVTKRKVLILLGTLLTFELILGLISLNDSVISGQVGTMILFSIVTPPFLFINYKLFRIAKRMRRNNAVAPMNTTVKAKINLKQISSCLLAVACFAILFIPTGILIVRYFSEKPTSTKVRLSWLWTKTIFSMNSTFNCLIFYWKNKILRTEARRVLSMLKNYTGR